MGGALTNGISALLKGPQGAPLPLCLSCEDTVKGQLSGNQGQGSHQTLNVPASGSQTSQPPKLRNVCCL